MVKAAKTKKAAEGINSKLQLVIKSGEYTHNTKKKRFVQANTFLGDFF